MPLYNSYVVSQYLVYRKQQIVLARQALQKNDLEAVRKFVRTALVLSYWRRVAKRDLAQGHTLQRNVTREQEELGKYLELHHRWLCTPKAA